MLVFNIPNMAASVWTSNRKIVILVTRLMGKVSRIFVLCQERDKTLPPLAVFARICLVRNIYPSTILHRHYNQQFPNHHEKINP